MPFCDCSVSVLRQTYDVLWLTKQLFRFVLLRLEIPFILESADKWGGFGIQSMLLALKMITTKHPIEILILYLRLANEVAIIRR